MVAMCGTVNAPHIQFELSSLFDVGRPLRFFLLPIVSPCFICSICANYQGSFASLLASGPCSVPASGGLWHLQSPHVKRPNLNIVTNKCAPFLAS